MRSFKFFALLYLVSMTEFASADSVQFTANAVMSTPGRADISTYLYYSTGRIRKEFFYYGEPVIQILDANKHISLMCFTEQQLCYENNTLEEINIGIESAISSPCETTEILSCENEGIIEFNSRPATQWKITAKDGESEKVTNLWIDTESNIPVKQILPNGTSIELEWMGVEKLNNRDTDKWTQHIKLVTGENRESIQWFDKELKISIRESFPNGNSQELKHIEVKKLQEKLFSIPEGFEKKSMKDLQDQSKNTAR